MHLYTSNCDTEWFCVNHSARTISPVIRWMYTMQWWPKTFPQIIICFELVYWKLVSFNNPIGPHGNTWTYRILFFSVLKVKKPKWSKKKVPNLIKSYINQFGYVVSLTHHDHWSRTQPKTTFIFVHFSLLSRQMNKSRKKKISSSWHFGMNLLLWFWIGFCK